MKNFQKSILLSLLVTAVVGAVLFYVWLPVLNVKSVGFWMYVIFLLAFFIGMYEIGLLIFRSWHERGQQRVALGAAAAIGVIFVVMIVLVFFSGTMFHAKSYSSLLKVDEDRDFETDMSETLSTDAIAIMDTKSARKLGNRKLGSLSSLVSQYNVSEDYSQINYQNTPVKVAALDYAGFFKYMKNRKSGIPGYVLVSPVNMSANYVSFEKNLHYVPSGYFSDNLMRHIRFGYPTKMIANINFEIDEEGKPYYIASVRDYTIGLFGGEDIVGAILVDPVSGDMKYYDVSQVPRWVDIVYDGDLLCDQYDYFGQLRNGYWNAHLSAEGCKVTTDDYGYVALEDDIWVYTGVTSVNNDASNIGFVLMNERTKEARFYSIPGADEASAMSAAEGEVQQYKYQASFPSLINVDGNATYIMVLKDSGGLVKMYAAVNAEQYNIVATAGNQKDCINKYRRIMANGGVESEELQNAGNASDSSGTQSEPEEEIDETLYEEVEVTVRKMEQIVVEGNTYLYLLTEEGNTYHAKYVDVLDMMQVEEGDKITIRVYEDRFLCVE